MKKLKRKEERDAKGIRNQIIGEAPIIRDKKFEQFYLPLLYRILMNMSSFCQAKIALRVI